MLLNFKATNFLSIKNEISVSFIGNKKIKRLPNNKVIKKSKEEENLWILKSLIFYGGNASGKTNIIKALLALKDLSLNSWGYKIGGNTGISPFLLESKSKIGNTIFEIEFLLNGNKYIYFIELNNNLIVSENLSSSKGNNIFNRNLDQVNIDHSAIGMEGELILIHPRENQTLLSLLFDRISTKSKLIKDISEFFLGINFCLNNNDYTGLTLSKVSDKKYKEIILNFLKNADINIIDILQEEKILNNDEVNNIPNELFINGIKPNLIKEVKTFFTHPSYNNDIISGEESFDFMTQESEGTKRLFGLIGPIIQTIENHGVLFIDEIDTHLHYLLLENLIKFIHESGLSNGAQFLFSTHNLDLLDLNLFRKDQIWFTEKNYQGGTSIHTLDKYQEKQIRNNSDIKTAYKEGLFGGLPILSNFYI